MATAKRRIFDDARRDEYRGQRPDFTPDEKATLTTRGAWEEGGRLYVRVAAETFSREEVEAIYEVYPARRDDALSLHPNRGSIAGAAVGFDSHAFRDGGPIFQAAVRTAKRLAKNVTTDQVGQEDLIEKSREGK